MLDRLMGVLTLKAPVYRQIADDKSATGQAAIIVVVFAVIGALLGAIVTAVVGSSLAGTTGVTVPAASPVASFITTIVNAIIGWLVGSWVFAFVSKTFFGGKTATDEMLRVFGFTQIFQILSFIPCIGGIAALVLSVIGAIIGIREASEFDTTKAILTGVIGFVVLLVVYFIVGMILGAVGL